MNKYEHFQIKLPAKFKYLNVFSAYIDSLLTHMEGLQDPKETVYLLQLAVHEVCNNIVEHAYAHQDGYIWLQFSISYAERHIMVDTQDEGQQFDISEVAEPDLDTPAEQGYGLYLARQIMDIVEYKHENGYNLWHMEKKL